MNTPDRIAAAMKILIADDARLKAAGVNRNDPSTWRPDLITPLICGCGKNPSTPEPHSCPFAEEIHGNFEEGCSCCDACVDECSRDI